MEKFDDDDAFAVANKAETNKLKDLCAVFELKKPKCVELWEKKLKK